MNPNLLDALLAAGHHLLAFALAALLFAEWAVAGQPPEPRLVTLLARLDMSYGAVAGLLLLAGGARLLWGAKGWAYYLGSHAFWVKLACFLAIGLLSLRPTLRILGWRRRAGLPGCGELRALRRWMMAQLILVPPILLCASLMARGLG